jgi:hypothetical protein
MINAIWSFLTMAELDLVVENVKTLLFGDGRVLVGEAFDEACFGVGGADEFVRGGLDCWVASERIDKAVWETAGGRHGWSYSFLVRGGVWFGLVFLLVCGSFGRGLVGVMED